MNVTHQSHTNVLFGAQSMLQQLRDRKKQVETEQQQAAQSAKELREQEAQQAMLSAFNAPDCQNFLTNKQIGEFSGVQLLQAFKEASQHKKYGISDTDFVNRNFSKEDQKVAKEIFTKMHNTKLIEYTHDGVGWQGGYVVSDVGKYALEKLG